MSPTHEWFTPTVVESGSGLETVPSKRKSRSVIDRKPGYRHHQVHPGRVVIRDGHRRAGIANYSTEHKSAKLMQTPKPMLSLLATLSLTRLRSG